MFVVGAWELIELEARWYMVAAPKCSKPNTAVFSLPNTPKQTDAGR
jgi:hypothetical protein